MKESFWKENEKKRSSSVQGKLLIMTETEMVHCLISVVNGIAMIPDPFYISLWSDEVRLKSRFD